MLPYLWNEADDIPLHRVPVRLKSQPSFLTSLTLSFVDCKMRSINPDLCTLWVVENSREDWGSEQKKCPCKVTEQIGSRAAAKTKMCWSPILPPLCHANNAQVAETQVMCFNGGNSLTFFFISLASSGKWAQNPWCTGHKPPGWISLPTYTQQLPPLDPSCSRHLPSQGSLSYCGSEGPLRRLSAHL